MNRGTVQNLFAAAVVGLLLGLSPHTSANRLVPSVVGGVAAGAVVLGIRERRRRRGTEVAQTRTVDGAAWFSPLLLAAGLVFLVVFASALAFLYGEWTATIWENGHGLFVPFVAAFLAHRALAKEPPAGPESSPWGFAFVSAGLLLAVLDAGIRTGWLSALGLVVCLPGLSLLLLGARRTRAIALPLALCLFMIPIPSAISSNLQLPQATGVLTEWMVEQFGIPVLRLSSVISLPNEVFAISDRCAGISALLAAIPVSILFAVHTRAVWRRVLLLLAPWPLVVFFSALRCAVLIVVTHHAGEAVLEMATHGLSGIAAFWSAMIALWLMTERGTLQRVFA